jgi:YfiR/HmsC-like
MIEISPAQSNHAPGAANVERRRSASAQRTLAAVLLTAILFAAGVPSWAQEAPPDEYQVKLAFLYNFTKFVDWPPQAFARPDSPLVIGIVGGDPFGQDLERELSTRTTRGHLIVIKRLRWQDDWAACHVLFIRAEERKRLPEILARLKGLDVLTVGEASGFLKRGGQIEFSFEANHLRFKVNLEPARRTHLNLSSKLLALATSVEGLDSQRRASNVPTP